jgi:hypothetical protein
MRLVLVSALAAIALSVAAGPALATTGHGFASAFGAAGNGDGQFGAGGPSGVAVDPVSGDVLVVDPGHVGVDGVSPEPRIERFDAAGTFQNAFSIVDPIYSSPGSVAVDPSGGGAVYVSLVSDTTGAGAVFKYNAAGTFQHVLDTTGSGTTINNPAPIAVDPADGTVYAMGGDDGGVQVVDSFSGATGAFLRSFDGTSGSPDDSGFACPNALAVDASHNVYVSDPCNARVNRYTPAGAFDTTIDDGGHGPPAAMTIDPTSGEAFIAEFGPTGLQVAAYTGTTRGQVFDASATVSLAQLAVDPTSGTVFAADNGAGVVDRFTTFIGPTVTTDAASPVAGTSATLNGTVDPGGVAASYHFEYSLDTSYGTSTSTSAAGSGNGPVPASAAITGLTPNQTYHYRIVGTNASGSITGADQSLTTSPVAPTIVGSPFTSSMTPTSVRVHGVVNPNHTQTGWHVDYGIDTTYGSSTSPDASAGGGTVDAAVDLNVEGLQPATTYHYRITADNTGGVQHGPDATFRTAPATPGSAIDVTTAGATLVGTIDPHGVATTYHFEYGLSTSYGRSTAEADGGSDNGDKTVTTGIVGLAPSTTYHVRVVATSGSDTWSGADGSFTTPPVPTNTAGVATGVGTSTATLNGTVDTHGTAGTYQFEVSSLDSAYTLVSPERGLSAATGARSVSEAVSGLPAGETFTVRLVSNSQDGTGYSDLMTFATASVPRVFPAPPSAAATGVYGCTTPRLNAYDKKPHPGDVITIAGTDLGVGGTVSLGGTSPAPVDWTSTGFSVTVPDDADGTLPLTINCGNVSNTVAVAIFHQPSNTFSITGSVVSGTTATLTLKLPGVGKVTTSAAHTASTTTTITKAGIRTVKVTLSKAGKKALNKAKSHRLKVAVRFSYTPAGGTAATLTKTLTFKTGSKR